jgi:ketosteroid isomerase-like protein
MSHFSNTADGALAKLRRISQLRRKTMKIVLVFAIVLSFGVSGVSGQSPSADSLQQRILAKEREELDALKNGDLEAFAALLADEAVFLNSRGPSPKADVVKHVADFKLLDYSIDDVRFMPVGPKTGLIIYKLTQKGASQGREFTGRANISALWIERDGKWLCLFSQESPSK